MEELNYITRLYNFYDKKLSINNRLPEIYIGDFLEFEKANLIKPKEENWDREPKYEDVDELTNPDFLGFYEYSYGYEGKVFLYIDRIRDCARRYSTRLNFDFEETVDKLKFIVLLHELGHWFTHWVCKPTFDKEGVLFSELSKEVKESMAQLNVVWTLYNHKNSFAKGLREVFYYLVDKQPYPYSEFLRLDKKNGHLRNEKSFTSRYTILNRYLKILNNDRLLVNDYSFLFTGKTNIEFIRF